MVKHLERYLSAGVDLYSEIYKPIMLDIIRVQAPDCYRCKYGKSCETCQAECFEDAEKTFEQYGDETCAFMIEPLVQAGRRYENLLPRILAKTSQSM